MKSLLVILLSLVSAAQVSAQVTEAWVARYDGPAHDVDSAHGMVLDGAGNVYVTGESLGVGTALDFATVKYDSDGNQLWVARYDGPASGYDAANAMARDADGNLYVTGPSLGVGTDTDYATVKYNSDGNQQWVARYDGPASRYDVSKTIALDANGYIYVTGYSRGVDSQADYATVKYDSDGNQQWVARYNGPGNLDDYPNAIALDASGNVYVTGTSWGVGTQFDYATVKYDSDGNQLWVARYNGPADGTDTATAIAIDSAGNALVTGYSFGGVATNYDYATVKYDSDGNQLWVVRYNGPANADDNTNAVAVDAAGNVHVTGFSFSSGSEADYTTIKYDPDGLELWEARYSGWVNGRDSALAMTLDAAGNVYVTGESDNGIYHNLDYATVKYDSTGNQLWVAIYNGPGAGTLGGRDSAIAVALDVSGNVWVTGGSEGTVETGNDYATVKYSQP
jgi:uncharacterized delta-60 repeat protein